MEIKKPLWGERHSGILINYKENSVLFEKIFNELLNMLHINGVIDFELGGRIKDAGMLAGKISRCQTEQDKLTTQYEELGFRIVLPIHTYEEFDSLQIFFSAHSDFEKDYIENPRRDGLILGDDPKLCYRAFHIYTKYYFNKPIEIQLMTQDMVDECHYLTKKYGAYWKQKDFKEKRIQIGDER